MPEDTDNKNIPPNPGEIFKRERLRAGLAIEDVAMDLFLSVDQVEAIEKGRYERLPGPTYIVGYWRSYAHLLDVDADASIEYHRSSLDGSSAPIALQRNHQQAHGIQEKSRKRSAVVFLALSAIFLTGIWYWQNPEDNPFKQWVQSQANRQPDRTQTKTDQQKLAEDGQVTEPQITVVSEESSQEIVLSLPEPNFSDGFDDENESSDGATTGVTQSPVELELGADGSAVSAGQQIPTAGEPADPVLKQSGGLDGVGASDGQEDAVGLTGGIGEPPVADSDTSLGPVSGGGDVATEDLQQPETEAQPPTVQSAESGTSEGQVSQDESEEDSDQVEPPPESTTEIPEPVELTESVPAEERLSSQESVVEEPAAGDVQTDPDVAASGQVQGDANVSAADSVPGAEVEDEDVLTEISEDTDLFLASSESALPSGMNARPENKLRVVIESQTWLDIRDVTGAKLIYRTVEGGELIDLVGQPPFYVFIGAIEGVSIEYMGQPVAYEPDSSGVFARFRVGEVPQ